MQQIHFVGTDEKGGLYDKWQQHKLMKRERENRVTTVKIEKKLAWVGNEMLTENSSPKIQFKSVLFGFICVL